MTRALLLYLLMISCDSSVTAKGGTTNYVESRAEVDGRVEVVLKIDISSCIDLPEPDRLPCVEAIAETLKELNSAAEVLLCARDLEALPGDAGDHTPISCRKFFPVEDGDTSP